MKTIIIILAILLGTLTAQADWVKKNGLEQIQLPDSNFFFTKVNDSCTKMLLVSQKNLKLYIVDLASGKIDREQKIPKTFILCDYDFELESLVFLYDFSNTQALYKLSKNDSLEIFINSDITTDATYVFGRIYLINILNHDLHISINRTIHIGHGQLKYDVVYKTYYNLDTKQVYAPKVSITSSKLFQDGLFIKNGSSGYVGNKYGVFDIQNTKEVNVGSDKFQVLDISGNYLSCKVDDNLIRYIEVSSGKTLNLSTLDSNRNTFTQMTNYKLINSIAEAVFFKNNDSMYLLDNYNRKITNIIPFANGKLYFNNSNKLLYSFKDNNLYRTKITPTIKPNNEIIVSQSYFIIGDTIQLIKPDIYFYKNYSWEINGLKYEYPQPIFQINKPGSYDVKFSYIENGITKTILKEKAIIVVDSLKVKYSVTSKDGLVIQSPIVFAASSNFDNTTYKWEIERCNAFWDVVRVQYNYTTTTKTSSTFTEIFDNMDGNKAKLTVSNGYQAFVYNIDLQLGYNLLVNADKFKGSVPFVVNLNALVACNKCNPVSNSTDGSIEFDNKIVRFKDSLNNYKYTFYKPGKYNIKISCGSEYNMLYSKTYNSFITVFDTTNIFQAFPIKFRNSYSSNKYAMTQDADGYYLDFANEEANVQLFDNVGRLVKSYQIKDVQYIRKEDLERGVYFLQINVNGEVYHEKVLVE